MPAPTKKSVESGRVGRSIRNAYYAKIHAPSAVFQQLQAANGKVDMVVSGDGTTQDEFATHFNQLLDLVKANPWTNAALKSVDWDNAKIQFTNEISVQYRD